jgi:hypothetical protein
VLGPPRGERQLVRYRLPAGWQLAGLPTDVQLTAPFGSYSLRWRHEGDQVVVARELALATPRVPAADYAAFREFVLAVKAADERFVLLQEVR